ncbi:MAG: MBL fold metallo-hydrolase [Pseudomonadota bacterium]
MAEKIASGVWRLTAPNPSPMTFDGTQSYVIAPAEGAGPAVVVDPGPDDAGHVERLVAAAGGAVGAILVTHTHRDHTAGVARLQAATGAAVIAAGRHGLGRSAQMEALAASGAGIGGGEGADVAFAPDIALMEGAGGAGSLIEVALPAGAAPVTAMHTPGHLSNHLSFVLEDRGLVLTGDAVMGWSTTLVSPPDGDMAQQIATLAALEAHVAARPGTRFAPGHGPLVEDPGRLVAEHLAHRARRRAALVAALGEGPADAATLARRLYTETPPALMAAAARNVLATLLQLEAEGTARPLGPLAAGVAFALA